MLRSFDTLGWGGASDQWLHSKGDDLSSVPSIAHSTQDLLEQYRGPYAYHQICPDLSSDSVEYDQLIRESTNFYKFSQPMPDPFFLLPNTTTMKPETSIDGYVARPGAPFLPANITTYEAIKVRKTTLGYLELVRASPEHPARLYGQLKQFDVDRLLKTMSNDKL